MPILISDADKKEVIENLLAVRDSCTEALSNEWDRSDDGFEAMKQCLEICLDIIGYTYNEETDDDNN